MTKCCCVWRDRLRLVGPIIIRGGMGESEGGTTEVVKGDGGYVMGGVGFSA